VTYHGSALSFQGGIFRKRIETRKLPNYAIRTGFSDPFSKNPISLPVADFFYDFNLWQILLSNDRSEKSNLIEKSEIGQSLKSVRKRLLRVPFPGPRGLHLPRPPRFPFPRAAINGIPEVFH
jgi:hypothetical protein